MAPKIAAQMSGLIDCRIVGASDHEITPEEHALAVEIGHEIAARHGIDLAAHVAAHMAKLREWERCK